jgi:hypothetical protein
MRSANGRGDGFREELNPSYELLEAPKSDVLDNSPPPELE